jgi:hypothetical protein
MILTFIAFRLFLHWAPETDLNIGRYNIHHLFTGLILIVIGGVPLAIFRSGTKTLDVAIAVFGIGLGMALDEWVYLIATDGSNQSYLLPISYWGGAIVISVVCLYVIGLAVCKLNREREVRKRDG